MKKNAQKIIISIVIAIMALATVGCGIGPILQAVYNPTETSEASQDSEPDPGNIEDIDFEDEDQEALPYEYYYIPMNENDWTIVDNWVIDRDGNTIPEDEQYDVLYDVMTGEPQCLLRTEEIVKGEDEYGWIISATLSAVFDLDGTLLHDWEECRYAQGFGDYIVRRTGQNYNEGPGDDSKNVLWNFKTRDVLIENVSWVEKLSENEALLCDDYSNPICVVDRSGAGISEILLPGEYGFARAWDGYIIASTPYDEGVVGQYYLLTKKFEPILAYSSLQGSDGGKVLYYEDDSKGRERISGIINVSGEELYRVPQGESVTYFDENVVVTSIDNLTRRNYKIINLKTGKVLSEGSGDVICNVNIKNEKHSELFLILNSYSLQILDLNGWMSAEKDVQGATYGDILNNGFIHVMINFDDGEYSSMILDSELNEIIPLGVYDYIRQVNKWSGGGEYYGNAFICEKYQRNNFRSSVDIIDTKGNVLVEGLNTIYGSGPNRLAVRKGFDVGLTDWQGNWIVKQSIFSELQD